MKEYGFVDGNVNEKWLIIIVLFNVCLAWVH